jgi:2-dehydropantoate 2-reductase
MKFCIYGAGTIGGYVAVELATAGHDVCVIARGDHLKSIQKRGLILRIGGREKIAHVAADQNPWRFGFQDVVICALKAHPADISAPDFAPLLGPSTSVLMAMNGILSWYLQEIGRLAGVPTPVIDAVLALVQERGRAAQLYV